MKIRQFIEKFTVKPEEDIVNKFFLTKSINIDANHHKGCFNCEDKCNQRRMESESWTGIQHCWACNHINVIYHSDRMSGATTDVVECYTEWGDLKNTLLDD